MQQAFKRQFVAYWAVLTEIKPDTQDDVGEEWQRVTEGKEVGDKD